MERTTDVAPSLTPKSPFFINRNFGLLWIGQTVSDFGDTIYLMTLSLWIATLIAKNQPWAPAAVSGLMIVMALPTFTLGPLAGVFVDRWDKQWTMVCMDLIRAALILLLFPLTGLIPLPCVTEPLPALWQIGSIYGVTLAASICGQFFTPARFTLLSELLPECQRVHASVLEQTSGSIVKILGPFLVAPLLFLLGVQWALMMNAFSFAVSFVALLAMKRQRGSQETGRKTERVTFLHELKEGMHFYRQNRLMLTLLLSVLIVTLGTGALDALMIFFFQKNLHAPISLFGTLPTAAGVGSVLGALLATPLIKRLGLARLFWLSLYMIGLAVILFARQSVLWQALVFLGLACLPLGALNASVGPLLMSIIPHEIMGRVMSVFGTCQTLCNLVSISLAGFLGTFLVNFHISFLGIPFGTYDTIYLVTGWLFLLGALYAMLNLRRLKEVEEK